jgi:hypothetical protein
METTMRNLLATAALLLPAAAFAGGYAVPNTNARDLAMAGSLVAGQTDAIAAYVNPAALSGLEGISVVVNGTMIDFRSDWNAIDGTGASRESNLKPAWAPSVFASYGGKVNGMGWGSVPGSTSRSAGTCSGPGTGPAASASSP